MTRADVEIRFLTPDEWPLLRNVRLEALRDSPDAFTSDYTIEAARTGPQWRDRFSSSEWLAAIAPEGVVGIVGVTQDAPPESLTYIESGWVAPERRRQGVFTDLVQVVADRARGAGLTELMLWVLESNVEAALAYKKIGFVDTDESQLTGSQPGQYECRLRLPL